MQEKTSALSRRYRTHWIQDLDPSLEGQSIRLAGRVVHLRDHGGVVFAHLTDAVGEVQVRFNPDRFADLDLAREDWISVEGTLESRPEGTENVLNPRIRLPAHELVARELERCGRPAISLEKLPPLELPVATARRDQPEPGEGDEAGEEEAQQAVSEEVLLRHRPFALRRNDLQRALRLRSRAALTVRRYLGERGFNEIETPILAAYSPEGARDFRVPSRLHPRHAYSLPQSPQIYKQLLMIGGFDRYFQLARCFRDEDLRANRQPEFTQIDLEMSFVTEDDVIELVTGMMTTLLETLAEHGGTLERPFHFSRLTYDEAMALYGTDKPDLRIPLRLEELTEVFRETEFTIFRRYVDAGGAVVGVPVPAEARLGRQAINRLRAWAESAKLPPPAWGDRKDGAFVSTIDKYFSATEKEQLAARMEEGGQLFFTAARDLAEAQRIAGLLRAEIGSRSAAWDLDRAELVWVTDFPAFELVEGRLEPMHHPFTDLELPAEEAAEPGARLAIRSRAYDLVLNGEELGSGSIRIHDLAKQLRVLEMLGYDEARARRSFPHLIAGLEYGAPPHGGIALGFDRLISRLLDVDSIRQVIAFPKDGKGSCPMTGSPNPFEAEELRLLGLRTVAEEPESVGV